MSTPKEFLKCSNELSIINTVINGDRRNNTFLCHTCEGAHMTCNVDEESTHARNSIKNQTSGIKEKEWLF
jgi:hypothetical protein